VSTGTEIITIVKKNHYRAECTRMKYGKKFQIVGPATEKVERGTASS